MRRAYIRLEEDSEMKDALRALIPEAQEDMKRVKIDLSVDPPEINIEAEDTRALRAALNSYLTWLDITENITEEYGN